MPRRVPVAYDTLCHGGICHSGESRMSRPVYTMVIESSNPLCQMIWSSAALGKVSFVTSLHIESACTDRLITNFSRPSFDHYLPEWCRKACSFSLHNGGRYYCGYNMSHVIDIQRAYFSYVPKTYSI